jgi:4-hydroxybenzoate polyprenyltransferase
MTLPTPVTIKPVLALCRVSNLPTVWMNVLAAALLCGAPLQAPQVVLLALSMSCMYCGGMALNDLYDLAHDRLHQPYRPIPAGRIGAAQAWLVTGLLLTTGLALLLAAPHAAGVPAGLLLLAVIWVYDRFHKAYAASVLLMAWARLLVYVVTALALSGAVAAPVWLAAAFQAAWVLALSAVARAEVHGASDRCRWPPVPWLIAAMPLVDGALLALLAGPGWLAAGVAGSALTRFGQRHVRGD